MKTPLSVQILTKDNEGTIEGCLRSVEPLGARVFVGDLGSRDGTVKKCKSLKCEVISLSINDDLSWARNSVLRAADTVWHMMVEPWEELAPGSEKPIREIMMRAPQAYRINVMQSDLLTKEVRVWHGSLPIKFENPVFETLRCEATNMDVYALSRGGARNVDHDDLISKWMAKSPLSPEPIYYRACRDLVGKKWDSFLNHAELFLHHHKRQDMSFVMTQYYRAMVLCYIKRDYNSAARSLIPCLAKKPAMAEFWCLLGDIFYATNDYDRASCFYDNARVAGSRRLRSCDYPMEISKYKEYPEKMADACGKLKSSMSLYGVRSKDDV